MITPILIGILVLVIAAVVIVERFFPGDEAGLHASEFGGNMEITPSSGPSYVKDPRNTRIFAGTTGCSLLTELPYGGTHSRLRDSPTEQLKSNSLRQLRCCPRIANPD
jgi:hypothetical protein